MTPFSLPIDPAAHDANEQQMHDAYQNMQRGLIYPAPFARFSSFWTSLTGFSRKDAAGLLRKTRAFIHENYGSANTTASMGVAFSLYRNWCEEDGGSVPKGMEFAFPATASSRSEGKWVTSEVFARSSGAFRDSSATVWIYIKSDEEAHLKGVYDFVADIMQSFQHKNFAPLFQDCNRRDTRDSTAGKVLGCRFSENLNNPADPISVAAHSLIGTEDPGHMGGSFVLAQRFNVNWEQLHNMSEEQIEDLIGRTSDDVILPSRDTRTHIKSARFRDEFGNTRFVMRLGLPFGRSPYENTDLQYKGSNLRDEHGIYFVGLTKNIRILEGIMNQQIGDTDGFMNDRLFNHVRSDFGGFFYIPSRQDLGLDEMEWKGKSTKNWERYPGIDWSKLSRHFDEKSPNGRMYYNHKNYLYEMSTMDTDQRKKFLPPTNRILELLSDSFARWQDSWYFPKGQAEMQHLCAYVARDPDFGPEAAGKVMYASIAIRKAWAIRMTLRLYASDAYGYRGSRVINGEKQEGADTYRINPRELIVGAMPDLTLAQGRFVMPYLRKDEEVGNYFRGLSEASGVGHIVPNFQKLVDLGIGGLLAECDRYAAGVTDQGKLDFYESCRIALFGVQDHLTAYASLARSRAEALNESQADDRNNLLEIAERLDKLKTAKPGTMLEATQLIFTVFTCLQLNAEPVAIGRLDQYLAPFYQADLEAGRLSANEAQEIIDALWIKLDEKVLQNRMFVQDHQPLGNLAMGGASGPYPQGASMGQWIQQLTVGGVVADNAETATQAYNPVTVMCIRASSRLPLNAPCLSLRVHKDTPREILEEAAASILSGGAHPILLNDDKIIPGLQQSGFGIGEGGDNDNGYTPVAEKSGGKWNSEVELASARNYACDGCYEPMFTGQNWFTLGGFSTLEPLECALNQGRLYGSAGPVFLQGQNHSFRSKAPTDIASFRELVDLYLEHFYLLWAKAINGQLTTFDALASVCPSPLLSTLIDDCVAKGLDLYGGGARYNVYGPCFIALSTTVNSLYNIKQMVYEDRTAVTSLPELVECLMCDWGNKMVEPFVSSLVGPARVEARAERFRRLRAVALTYEKYGEGSARPDYLRPFNPDDLGTYSVDELGNYIAGEIARLTVKAFRDPFESTAAQMVGYAEKYGTKEQPFGGFQIQPGAGTFENFAAFGGGSGASADGRRNNGAIASDLSPSPNSGDQPAAHRPIDLKKALQSYAGEGAAAIWNGAPTDFNVPEDFPQEQLVDILMDFAKGSGSNILTVTCASPETMSAAPARPERYDLLRVRMGGWTEFFTSMFPVSQEQHLRRPMAEIEPGAE